MGKTQPKNLTRIDVGQSIEVLQPTKDKPLTDRVFQFYNWQHHDVLLTLNMVRGNGTLMYQKTGQLDYLNNIYTAIPMSEVNSESYSNVTQGSSVQLTITGNSCYTCWYFIKVRVQNASDA